MRRKLLTALCALLTALWAGAAWGATAIAIDSTNFPDNNFRQYVLANYNDGADNVDLDKVSANGLRIDPSSTYHPVADFTGIKHLSRP